MECKACEPVWEALEKAGVNTRSSIDRRLGICRWKNNGRDEVWVYSRNLSDEEQQLIRETIEDMGLYPMLPAPDWKEYMKDRGGDDGVST